jgi:LysM repeat protein
MVAGAAVLTPPNLETSSIETLVIAQAPQVIDPSTPEPPLPVSQQRSEPSTTSTPVAEQAVSLPSAPVDLIAASQSYPELTSEESLAEEASGRIHVIQRGESLTDIATRYQIDVSHLRSFNGLSSNQLRMPAGTFLIIPLGES